MSTSTEDSKLSDKVKRNKKKKWYKDKRDFKDSRDSKDSITLAIKVNMVKAGDKKRRRRKDKSEVTCFNCNKKGH